ncbi:MAG: hypothetical protein AAB920_04030 [Patescibacteria group bacterium]
MSKRMPGIHQDGRVYENFYFPYYFYVDIPKDYDHETQIQQFCDSLKFSERNRLIYRDERFAGVTDKLIPGEEYAVKIFQLTFPKEVALRQKSTDACLKFLKNQNYAIFAGMQGLAFLIMNDPLHLPIGTGVMVQDEKRALGILNCEPMWPSLIRYIDGSLRVMLMDANATLDEGECILCFSGPVSAV